MRRHLLAVFVVVVAFAVGGGVPARADLPQPTVVSEHPVEYTPHVLDGTVWSIAVNAGVRCSSWRCPHPPGRAVSAPQDYLPDVDERRARTEHDVESGEASSARRLAPLRSRPVGSCRCYWETNGRRACPSSVRSLTSARSSLSTFSR